MGRKHSHVDIFTRDVEDTEFDKALDARIYPTAKVFSIEGNTCVMTKDPYQTTFPTVEEFKEEQNKEDLTKYQLTQIRGLWMTSQGKVYVPQTLCRQILYFFHFGRTGGHQGVGRTYKRISKHFWWSEIKDHIQKYQSECLTCMRRRYRVDNHPTGSLIAAKPGDIVAVDIVGPVEHNQRRYYILTMLDHFTKYADAVVLTETTSTTIWQLFYVKWVCAWGCPHYLLTDNGPQFASEEFKRHLLLTTTE